MTLYKKIYFIFYLEKNVFMTKIQKDIYNVCKHYFALSDQYLTTINVERCILLCYKTVCNKYIGKIMILIASMQTKGLHDASLYVKSVCPNEQ